MYSFKKRLKILGKIFPYLWPSVWRIRLRFLFAALLVATTIILNICVPLVLREVIKAISTPSNLYYTVSFLLLTYGFLWTLSKITENFRLILMNRVLERGIHLLSLDVFNHLMNLSQRFHVGRKTGSIINAIDRAQQSMPSLFWGLFFTIIPTSIELLGATIVLIYLYGFLYGIILAIILIAYMLFSIIGTRWSTQAQRIANKKSGRAANKIVDSLLNFETVKYFGTQRYESEKCDRILQGREDAVTRHHVRGEYVLLGQGIIIGIGLTILIWLSGIKVLEGTLHVSDFVLINGYLLQFATPLGLFGFILRGMNEGISNFEDILKILKEEPDIKDSPNAKPLHVKKGGIVFDRVNFGYDPRRPILRELSFEIPAKKRVAIVGSTGAGKSTISKLLFRFYDVNQGAILIDDQNIKEVTQDSLHKAIGIVSQHTALFNTTLYENIIYGSQMPTEEDVEQAILHSHLDQLMSHLPDGIRTIVGEHGLKLSGGEKQRVAIARVLMKKPLIYIFDEATSALDTKTERAIQQNIEEISSNATTLLIAHRLSTVVHSDQILVLDHGKLVEQGTHKELIKHDGLYAHLWVKQQHH